MGNCCPASPTAPDAAEQVDTPFKVGQRKSPSERAKRSAAASRGQRRGPPRVDPSKWKFVKLRFAGPGEPGAAAPEQVQGPIGDGMKKVDANPELYEGMFYLNSAEALPEKSQSYYIVKRAKPGFAPESDDGGDMTWYGARYEALPDLDDVTHDQHTDTVLKTIKGKPIPGHILPGRGRAADMPGLSLLWDADPSDIRQGNMGDCWLLAAISALAEFDGAIAKLFRKTEGIESKPGPSENEYVVTLWDLSTWSEVDIRIDERLPLDPEGGPLGATSSKSAEVWVPYLEKAVAAHCGGWDEIAGGGTSDHALRLLTGCKECYWFMLEGPDAWSCNGCWDQGSKTWMPLNNSPRKNRGVFDAPWPAVGGGGPAGRRVSAGELFQRMCAWDDADYIMCAGSRGGSDKEDHGGIVDGHAYTVLACVNDAAGSGVNLVQVRNPWGDGEIKNGEWDDDGPGWQKHPAVKKLLNPKKADDGIFWLSEREFFQNYGAVWLCAKSMKD